MDKELTLRPLSRQAAEGLRFTRNKDISPYRTSFLLTEEHQQEWYEHVTRRDGNNRIWCFYFGEMCVAVGGLTSIQWENRLAEITLVVHHKERRMGYGAASVKLILDKAFNFLNLHTVFGEVYACGNTAFWLAQKPDFTTTLADRKYWNGQYYDSMYFSWTNPNDYHRTR